MPRSTLVMAMFTQSVGVPSTAYTPSAMVSSRKRPPQRQRMSNRAGFGERRHDGDLAERSQRISERFDALRMHAVIVGHQNTFHMS